MSGRIILCALTTAAIREAVRHTLSVRFIQRVRKYEDLDELTPYALRELVKAIYIEAPDKSSGKWHQGIRISYDLVGFIPVEELLKQETA